MANIQRWRGERALFDPARDFSSLQRSIDRLFEDFMSPLLSSEEPVQRPQWFQPQVDVEETDTHYVLSLDLPGVKKEDVRLEIKDNQLIVSAERKEERKEGSEKSSKFIRERFYGRFQRAFTLPSNVDPEAIEANYENGVVYLAIPKAEASKPRVIPIGEKKGGLLDRLFGKKEEKKEEREKLEKKEKVA